MQWIFRDRNFLNLIQYAGLLAAQENLVHNDQVAECNLAVRQKSYVFLDSSAKKQEIQNQ